MTREEIANVLKSLRINTGLTQAQAAEKIGRKQQTLASWETGQSQPDANTLFLLCNLYNASIDEAFGFKTKRRTITNQESALLDAYRANPQMQSAVDRLLGIGEAKVEKLPDKPTITMSAAAHGGASMSQELTPEEYEQWVKFRDGEQ